MERRMSYMTQMEIADAIAAGRAVIVPTGATEAHGPHMPVDTDTHQVSATIASSGQTSRDTSPTSRASRSRTAARTIPAPTTTPVIKTRREVSESVVLAASMTTPR